MSRNDRLPTSNYLNITVSCHWRVRHSGTTAARLGTAAATVRYPSFHDQKPKVVEPEQVNFVDLPELASP